MTTMTLPSGTKEETTDSKVCLSKCLNSLSEQVGLPQRRKAFAQTSGRLFRRHFWEGILATLPGSCPKAKVFYIVPLHSRCNAKRKQRNAVKKTFPVSQKVKHMMASLSLQFLFQ